MSKTKVAIALRYAPEEGELPYVTATGKGLMADRIRALGEKSGVPIMVDPALATALSHLAPGSPIPPAAFTAVAEILVHLFRLNDRLGQAKEGPRS